MARSGGALRKVGLFLLALVLAVGAWELYKAIGPPDGDEVFGWKLLPRANDISMPHVWTMTRRLLDPESRTSQRDNWQVVLEGAWFSLRLALTGFILGSAVGIGLATVMARYGIVRRGLLPYLVVSQTVPLIALAPLVVSWSGKVTVAGWDWPKWLSVAVLGAFLAFFPVAVGTLRGLESSSSTSLELMRSFAATGGQTLLKLRFPSAVPHMLPSLRLAAAASVVGVVVAEISTAQRGGVGRLVLEYARQATGDPAKVYGALLGAAAVGLTMAGVVALIERWAMRGRPRTEEIA